MAIDVCRQQGLGSLGLEMASLKLRLKQHCFEESFEEFCIDGMYGMPEAIIVLHISQQTQDASLELETRDDALGLHHR